MYEALLNEAYKEGVEVIRYPFRGHIKGLYFNKIIALNSKLDTTAQLTCILAEELGHHFTSVGNILDQSYLINCKQEQRARRWGDERLVPLDKLISAYRLGIHSAHELAESLGVTDSFLAAALRYYKSKYGTHCRVKDSWICFEPFRVLSKI